MKINVKSDCRGMDSQEVVEQIFEDRNIEDYWHFLHPTVDDLLPLDALENAAEAAQIVIDAVDNKQSIGILADTDTDGISAGTIMYRYLRDLDANVEIFIDHGKQHGLQPEDLDKYKHCNLFIVVDSLDKDCLCYQELKRNSQIDNIIVLDHHAIDPNVPYDDCITLVSSQRNYDNPDLSGAGVTWKFCKLIDEICDLYYADQYVDLAATGLVADMVNMINPENRYIVAVGLREINNPAIKKIVGGFEWNATAIAFSVAPLVNSSNRLDRNEDALQAFLVDDNKSVLKYVKAMKSCKEEQNVEIDGLLEDVEKQCMDQLDKKMMIVEIDTEYGIAGLLGNKLLSKYKRPLLIVKEQDDKYQGSMRAVGVEDFRAMLNESGLAISMGHELAASVEFSKADRVALVEYMEQHLPEVGSDLSQEADIWLDVADVDREMIARMKEIDKISGTGFKQIRVYLDGITDYDIMSMSGGKHLVVKPADTQLQLIQWNFNGDWDELYDASLMGDELECIVTLNMGFIGRNFMLQGICDYVGVKDECKVD